MKPKIKVITGGIKSGKTTYLQELLSSQENVAGIIQLAENNSRFFVDVSSGEKRELTSLNENQDTFNIGNFLFRKSAFIWAKEKLSAALKNNHKIIAIDEFGLLELHGEGLEPVFGEIVREAKSSSGFQLIVAIRKSLLDDFLKKFDIAKNEIEVEEIENNINQ